MAMKRTGGWSGIAITASLLVIHLVLINACRADTDLERVTKNLRAALIGKAAWPTEPYKAEEAFASLRADGSWADQDYRDRDRLHWKAFDHLPRLESMVRAYCQPGNALTGKRAVLNGCVIALKFWLDKDPKNENWWHNEIGVPSLMGEILVMLGNDAPADLRERGIELMKRAHWEKQTGANLTDETRIQVMRGCVSGSADLISQAYDRSWKEVRLAGENEDGMQLDHSFHQHGPLIYCEGYGAVFVHDIVQFVQYAQGTQYQIPPGDQALFDAYLIDGPAWMIRGGKWDFGTCGRGICRPKRIAGSETDAIEQMAELPGNNQPELQSIAARLKASDDKSAPVGNRQYWLSDFMINRRANYFASARMYSTRTLNTDQLTNGENRKSHHIADGATCLMVSGDEYFDIFPVWDWLRIPGTTIEQNTPLDPKEVSHLGQSPLVGEVSDGTFGCSSMHLITGPLRAIKSWFFFDSEMVCLGTDINCPTRNNVFTSLNQCVLHGAIEYSGSADAMPAGDRDLKKTQWVWHDSIGYVFPEPTDVHLKNQAQTGAWSDIGTGPEKPVSEDVFSLWINHGPAVTNGSYAYVLIPGSTAAETVAEARHLPLQIIQNSSSVQAVWHDQLHLLEAVFYQPVKLKVDGMTIAVDQPCLLMMKHDGEKIRLTVARLQDIGRNVDVSFSVAVHGTNAEHGDGASTVRIAMPTGLLAGSSVVQDLTVGD